MRTWIVEHRPDIVIAVAIAAVLALLFAVGVAVVFEVFNVGSRIRDRIRQAKNKRAERSIIELRTRIEAQEAYRDSMASDMGRTLVMFRWVFLILFCFGASLMCYLISNSSFAKGLPASRNLNPFTGISFAFATIGTVGGAGAIQQSASYDTPLKMTEMFKRLDDEITGMKTKLGVLEHGEK